MKKTLLVTAVALCLAVSSVTAKSTTLHDTNYNLQTLVKVNPFCVSIAKGDIETVKKLIGLGADVNQKSNGMTPAMYAAKFNRAEILRLLIAKGANLKTKSEKGWTAMRFAELSNAKDAKEIIKKALSEK